MTHPFPHSYEVTVERSAQKMAILKDSDAQPIEAAAPVQFDGPPGYFSPETLLLSSISLCYMTTLESLAKRQNITIQNFKAQIKGLLDKTKDGLVFTSIDLSVDVQTNPEQVESLKSLMPTAEKYCIISNTLRVPVTLSFKVS